jgi:enoyl-CoA hydratase/carnithine racemase
VNRIVSPDALLPQAEAIARKICENGPLAVQATKRIARMGQEMSFETARQSAEMIRYILRQTEDAQEGPRAFVERRKPIYKGR